MTRLILLVTLLLSPVLAVAQDQEQSLSEMVNGHVLPRFEALAEQTKALAEAAEQDCRPDSAPLRTAFGTAFDAWVSVSHLRFGPTETEDRAFGLAFWPDSRGATPRTLATMIAEQDQIAASPDVYREVSIAARGFYALEFLLYDETLMRAGEAEYHCMLVRTITSDIAATSGAIWRDWRDSHATLMLNPGPDALYQSHDEVRRQMLTALSTGLQFTSESRLGRPLGTFERPRPNRAEVRRSGRSARHVSLSLAALQDLAAKLAGADAELRGLLDQRFESARSRLSQLDDPVFAGVADPQARLRVETLQLSVEAIRSTVRDVLGPSLGLAAGFNAMDGD